MRISPLLSVTASILTATLVICCSQAENKNATPEPAVAPTQTAGQTASPTATTSVSNAAVVSNTSPPPASSLKSLPPEGGDKPTQAEVDGYAYSYKKDSEKTVATFGAKLLPWDRDIVAAAVRDIIYRSYGDSVDSALRIEGNGPVQTIRIAGSKYQYVVVPITEPTGEIHSLIITRLN
jgi:hypothetical protein